MKTKLIPILLFSVSMMFAQPLYYEEFAEIGFNELQIEKLASYNLELKNLSFFSDRTSDVFIIFFDRIENVQTREELGTVINFLKEKTSPILIDLSFLLATYDDFNDIVRLRGTIQSTNLKNRISANIAFSFTETSLSNCYLLVDYDASNWLFIDTLKLKIGSGIFTYNVNPDRTIGNGIKESIRIPIDEKLFNQLIMIETEEMIIRVIGDSTYHQERLEAVMLKEIISLIKLYSNLESQDEMDSTLSDYFNPPMDLR